MTPANKITILAGLTLYVEVRSTITFVLGYTIGCLVFGINPLQGQVLLALFILLFGLIPIYGLSFLLGALIFKVKQANSLLNNLQLLLAIISGVFSQLRYYLFLYNFLLMYSLASISIMIYKLL